MQYKIMIIEDDGQIACLLKEELQKYQYQCYVCTDFEKIVETFNEFHPHLVLVDINLPVYDGFFWCRQIRNVSKCPILVVSARSGDMEQVYAMENGADDYLVKPFSREVLVAKVNAMIRRNYGDYAIRKNESIEKLGEMSLCKETFVMRFKDKKVVLSSKETRIMALFIEKYPMVISREKLMSTLWDEDSFIEENTLNVNIARVRKRLAEIGAPYQIETVRGVGYRIIEGEEI